MKQKTRENNPNRVKNTKKNNENRKQESAKIQNQNTTKNKRIVDNIQETVKQQKNHNRDKPIQGMDQTLDPFVNCV